MPTVFVDESETFKVCKGQEYFVIATFTVGDPERTAKALKKWQKKKFPKAKRRQSEIKFSETGISDDLRIRTMKYISSLDVRIHYGFLRCDQLPASSFDKHGIREGYLYTQILGEVLETYFPISDRIFMARCDKRQLKNLKKSEFIEILRARLLPLASTGTMIDVKQIDSTSDPNIQIADWIAGAIASYLNKKPLGKHYYDILKDNIIGMPIELFKQNT